MSHLNSAAPDRAIAADTRDRAAALLAIAPSLATELATALLHACERQGASLDPAVGAIAWRARAEAHLYSGEQMAAKAAYEEACAAAETAGETGLLGQILVGRVGLMNVTGEEKSARTLASRAAALLESAGDHAYLAKLHMNQGNAAYYAQDYDAALNAYTEARRLWDQEPSSVDPSMRVGLLMNTGIACTNLGRLADAHRLLHEAGDTASNHGLLLLTAQSDSNLAFVELLDGNFRRGLALLERATATFDAEGARSLLAGAQLSRAEAYLELGMPVEALDLALEACRTFASEGMMTDAMLAQIAAARGRMAARAPSTALPLLESAQAHFAHHAMDPRAHACALHQGEARLMLDDANRALALAESALRAFETSGSRTWSARARRLLVETLLRTGKAPAAELALGHGLESLGELPAGERWRLWAIAGRVALANGDHRLAEDRLLNAARDVERQRRLIPSMGIRARAFEEQVGVYHALVDLELNARQPDNYRLLAAMDAARARGFREQWLSPRVQASSPSLDDERLLLGSLTHRLEQAELAGDAGASALRSQVQDVERRIDSTLARADQGAGDTFPFDWTTDNVASARERAESLARHLAPGEVVCQYFVTEASLVAMVMQSNGLVRLPLTARVDDLRALAEDLSLQIDSMALAASAGVETNRAFQKAAADTLLQKLYSALIAPLAPLLPARARLVILPHRFLHHVPFECLFDGERYLADRCLVTRAPTTEFILARRQRNETSDDAVLITGAVGSGPPAVAEEVALVAGRLGERAKVRIDPTSAELMTALSHPGTVHMSTHGHFRDDNPLFSRLTTQDGALFLADLLNATMRANLVVLSACNTGRCFAGRGDDLSGVTHGLLAAGAGTLVASRWRVHDLATCELMGSFYSELAQQVPGAWGAAAAMRRAAADLRQRYPHPFYWGGFSVYGAPHPTG